VRVGVGRLGLGGLAAGAVRALGDDEVKLLTGSV
jgi:hypothetical protein